MKQALFITIILLILVGSILAQDQNDSSVNQYNQAQEVGDSLDNDNTNTQSYETDINDPNTNSQVTEKPSKEKTQGRKTSHSSEAKPNADVREVGMGEYSSPAKPEY